MIEIKNRWTGTTIYQSEADTLFDALAEAARRRADLRGAVLRGADLSRAVLSGADLRGADLSRAVLSGADLRGADLSRAVLRGAVLSGAVLSGADLSGAVLSRADLSGAVLSGADLRGADLSGAVLSRADLSGAQLRPIKADVWYVLTQSRAEVPGLRAALITGQIDGSAYEGACACLVGTLANVRGCDYHDLRPNSDSAAERWFLALRPGDTPENSSVAAITLGWIDEWLALNEFAIPIPELV